MTTATAGTTAPAGRSRAQWPVPAALILLSLIPVIAGAARIADLAGGAVTAQNARFFASPVPVVAHIASVTVFCLLGAFQFVPVLRRAGRRWHRVAGRVLVPAGLLAALSGLWMSVFYPLPEGDGEVLLILRLVFGSAMVASIVLAVLAIRRRDFVRHGAWMTRGYAIGTAAGTQALVQIPWLLLVGPTGETTRAVLMGAAWVINLAVAEYAIRRSSRPSVRPSASGRRLAGRRSAASR